MRVVVRFKELGLFAIVWAVILSSGLSRAEDPKPKPAKAKTPEGAKTLESTKTPSGTKTKAKKVSLSPANRPIMLPPDRETLHALLLLHNDVRARSGLPPLKLHPKLTAAAQRYAEYSLRKHKFGHSADGNSPDERITAEGLAHNGWAENIGWGHYSPITVMQSWMRSSGHRKNILDSYTHVGFGRAGTKWVTVFANPVETTDSKSSADESAAGR